MRFVALFASLVAAVAVAMLGGRAAAEDAYPTRAITLVVPFTAGGSVDLVARLLGDHLSRKLGQPVVVDNVSGAGGTIAAARVARSAPDGYTILAGNLGTQVSSVGNYKDLPYDPRHDFAPVMLAANTPMVLIVNNDLPCRSLQSFAACAKANGAPLIVGSAGVGSISHLAYLLFTTVAKVKTQHVPYRGLPQADTDLMAGRIDAVFDQTILASPYIKAGKVTALAVMAPGRSAILPDIPSSAEAGMPELQVNAWTGFFAPRATPSGVIRQLNAALASAFADDAIVTRLTTLGVDIPAPEQRTPQALEELVKAEFKKWIPLIQSAERGQ